MEGVLTTKKTKIIHSGRDSKKQAGFVNPPLYAGSTILFPNVKAYEDAGRGKAFFEETKNATSSDYAYGISGTPTTFALQDVLCELEGGDNCVITPSGLSAITLTLNALLRKDDHLLMVDTVYGPTRRFCNKELKKFGVETEYYDPLTGGYIEKLIKKNTKVIFLESPGSLTFEVQDISAIAKVAKKHGITTIMDNSWATPLFSSPLEYGIDVSIQALTKYVGGHSDLLLGAVISKDSGNKRKILSAYRNAGINSSAFDCWLALRGIRSIAPRLEYQQKSAIKIASWLDGRKEVKRIIYPPHKKDVGHKLWKKYYSGGASLFTFILKDKYTEKQAHKFVNALKLFGIGSSWGGYESLAVPFNPADIRTATSWKEKGQCVRLYIGLEEADDLIEDLKSAFKKL